MEGAAVVLLGLVALGSLAQILFFASVVLSARRAARRIAALRASLAADLQPLRASALGVRRNADALRAIVERYRSEPEVGEVETPPEGPGPLERVIGAVAAARGLVRGVSLYRRLRRA